MLGMMYLNSKFVMNSSQIFEIGMKMTGIMIEQTNEKRSRSVRTCDASEFKPLPKSDAILIG